MKTKSLKCALAISVAALIAVACEPETVTPAGSTVTASRSAGDQTESLVGTLWKSTNYDDGALASQYGYDLQLLSTDYFYFVNDSIISRTLRFEAWSGEDYRDSISRDFEEWKYGFNGVDSGYFYPVEREWQRMTFVRESPNVIKTGEGHITYYRVDKYDF